MQNKRSIEDRIKVLKVLGDIPLLSQEKERIVSNLYNLDLDKIIAAKGLPDFIKKVAVELQSKRYFTVGFYFSSLSNQDVSFLHKLVSAVETKDTGSVIFSAAEQEQMYKDFLLMGMLLCLASGKSTLNPDEIMQMKHSLHNFILTEWVFRFKKTHALLRHNWDLFEHDKVIAVPYKSGGSGKLTT